MDAEKQTESSTKVEPTTSESQNIEPAPNSPDQNVENSGQEGETTANQNGGILSEDEEDEIVCVYI